jgi:hypothetical protein
MKLRAARRLAAIYAQTGMGNYIVVFSTTHGYWELAPKPYRGWKRGIVKSQHFPTVL